MTKARKLELRAVVVLIAGLLALATVWAGSALGGGSGGNDRAPTGKNVPAQKSDPGFVDGMARLMKSQTVVAYGTRLPSIFTGFELPSGIRPRCSLVPVPFGPWHARHFCAYTAAPSLTVPRPGGSSVPAGETAVSRALISSGLAVVPSR